MAENTVNTDILNNINPVGQNNSAVQDIQNYTPQDLSPQQQQAFQSQYTPQTGALSPHDYYPDLGHNINVGNYSGSEIGSTTLFAPGGGLVPLGMMDARDAAVQRAALQKAKEIEDFRKSYQSPTTKHVAVQKNLTDQYYNGLQQWNQNALTKAGGDQAKAARMLKNDPKFNAWNKSMQDTAKFHDAIVEHGAELNNSEKDPNFVLSPETRKAWQDIQSGVAYLNKNPFDEKGHAIGQKFMQTRALYDLDKSVNTAIDKAIPNIEQLPPTYTSRGKNETATYLEKEYFTPQAKEDIAKNIYMEKYQGTDIPYEAVKKKVDAMLGEKIKRKTDTYDKWFKPDANSGAEDYSNASPVSQTSFNTGSKYSTMEKDPETGEEKEVWHNTANKEIHSELSYKTSANDERKEISIPLSKNTVDLQGKKLESQSGQVKGTVSQVFQGFYDKANKKWLSPEEAKKFKESNVKSHNIVAKPAVMFNIKEKEGEKGQEGAQNAIIVDAEEIKGKFPASKKGQQGFDHKIDELEQKSNKDNEIYHKKAEEVKTNKSKVEDLRKKYNY